MVCIQFQMMMFFVRSVETNTTEIDIQLLLKIILLEALNLQRKHAMAN